LNSKTDRRRRRRKSKSTVQGSGRNGKGSLAPNARLPENYKKATNAFPQSWLNYKSSEVEGGQGFFWGEALPTKKDQCLEGEGSIRVPQIPQSFEKGKSWRKKGQGWRTPSSEKKKGMCGVADAETL